MCEHRTEGSAGCAALWEPATTTESDSSHKGTARAQNGQQGQSPARNSWRGRDRHPRRRRRGRHPLKRSGSDGDWRYGDHSPSRPGDRTSPPRCGDRGHPRFQGSAPITRRDRCRGQLWRDRCFQDADQPLLAGHVEPHRRYSCPESRAARGHLRRALGVPGLPRAVDRTALAAEAIYDDMRRMDVVLWESSARWTASRPAPSADGGQGWLSPACRRTAQARVDDHGRRDGDRGSDELEQVRSIWHLRLTSPLSHR